MGLEIDVEEITLLYGALLTLFIFAYGLFEALKLLESR